MVVDDVVLVVDHDRLRIRVVLHQTDAGNGEIDFVSEDFDILRRVRELKIAVALRSAFLRFGGGVSIDALHDGVVRQDQVLLQVVSVDPRGRDDVQDIAVSLNGVDVSVERGRLVQGLPDRIVIEQLGQRVARDDGDAGSADIVGGDPEIPLVVDHQVHQLALALQISCQSDSRFARAEINTVNAVLLAGDEQKPVFFGIEHSVDLVGNGKVVEHFPAFHVVPVNDPAVLRHKQRRVVGINLKEPRVHEDLIPVLVVDALGYLIVTVVPLEIERDIADIFPVRPRDGGFRAFRNVVDDCAVVLGRDIQQVLLFVQNDAGDDAGVHEQGLKMIVFVHIDMLGCTNVKRAALRRQRPDIDDRVFLAVKFKALVCYEFL